jgi:slime mold repeat-containing protein
MSPVPKGEVQQIQQAAPIATIPPPNGPIGPCGDVDCCADCVDDACFTRTCNARTGACKSASKCKPPSCMVLSACDMASGACSYTPGGEGTNCDDGNACTDGTTCTGGVCVGGTAKVCPAPGGQCQTASCDPATGCTTQLLNGTTCDLGDRCITKDTCVNGTCTHGPPVVCQPMTCKKPGNCSGGTCSYQNDDGASCSDGDVCNGAETCSGGSCVKSSGPLDCKDSNPCTSDSCNPKTGCSVTNVKDGTVCAPPTECGAASTCQAGMCTIAPTQKSCDDHNPCTSDSCGANQTCLHANLDGTSCSDGDPCNGEERCSLGVCKPGTPLSCPASRQCHLAGACDKKSGMCSDPLAPDGTACDDGNPCTTGDACKRGTCAGTATSPCAPSPADAAVDAKKPADGPVDDVDAPAPPSAQDGGTSTGQPGGPGPTGGTGGTVSDDGAAGVEDSGAAGTGGRAGTAADGAAGGAKAKGVAIGGCSLGHARSAWPWALIVALLARRRLRGGKTAPPSSPAG